MKSIPTGYAGPNESYPFDNPLSTHTPSFVGRYDELAVLTREASKLASGEGGVLLLEGESGGGKTRLANEFLKSCESSHYWILRGSALGQVAPKPFQLLTDFVSEIALKASKNSEFQEHLCNLVSGYESDLISSFPILERALSAGLGRFSKSDSAKSQKYSEYRLFSALTSLFQSIGSQRNPAIVFFDDCQWADETSMKFLQHWSKIQIEKQNFLLFILAFRPEEISDVHPLRKLSGVSGVFLNPLRSSEISSLVESVSGFLPKKALEVITELSLGSPFLAQAVLQGLIETKALQLDSSGQWEIDNLVMDAVQSSTEAAEFLIRRLNLLPYSEKRLLSIGALLGRSFTLAELTELSGGNSKEIILALKRAGDRQLIWDDPTRTTFTFVHDKIRESLLGLLSPAEKKQLHSTAAERLEQYDSSRDFEIAYHYHHANKNELAISYALSAAKKAAARFAFEVAESMYRIAEKGLCSADDPRAYSVFSGLGDVLVSRGKFDEAKEIFSRIENPEGDRGLKIELVTKFGDIAFNQGDLASASLFYEQALEQLGEIIPRSQFSFVFRTLKEVFVQFLHTLLPSFFLEQYSVMPDEILKRLDLHIKIGYPWWFQKGPLPTLWVHLRSLNLVEKYQATVQEGLIYGQHGVIMALSFATLSTKLRDRGVLYGKKAIEICQKLDDLAALATCHDFYSMTTLAASRLNESAHICSVGGRLLKQTGNLWDYCNIRLIEAHVQYLLGEYESSRRICEDTYVLAKEIGADQNAGISTKFWALCSNGDIPDQVLKPELEKDWGNNFQSKIQVLGAGAFQALFAQKNYDRAIDFLEQAMQLIQEKKFMNEFFGAYPSFLAMAYRSKLLSLSESSMDEKKKLIKKLKKTLKYAKKVSKVFLNYRAFALREAGLFEIYNGNQKKAYQYFDRSAKYAMKLEQKMELQLTRAALKTTNTS